MTKLTDEEHHARAMLMGKVYNKAMSAYEDDKWGFLKAPIDADTLEPLPDVQVYDRLMKTYNADLQVIQDALNCPNKDIGPW